MLIAKNLSAGYGAMRVVRDVNLHLRAGQITAVLGRNGAGRSTLAKALMGLVDWQGELHFKGHNLRSLATYQLARLGMAYVPEERDIFGFLSVEENLRLGQRSRGIGRGAHALAYAYALFPILAERQHIAAAALSGGEQQMLAIARALMNQPQCLILDEPSEGLAPAILQTLRALLVELRQQGMAILLIEQKRDWALDLADHAIVLGAGQVVLAGTAQTLRQRPDVLQTWLQV